MHLNLMARLNMISPGPGAGSAKARPSPPFCLVAEGQTHKLLQMGQRKRGLVEVKSTLVGWGMREDFLLAGGTT